MEVTAAITDQATVEAVGEEAAGVESGSSRWEGLSEHRAVKCCWVLILVSITTTI